MASSLPRVRTATSVLALLALLATTLLPAPAPTPVEAAASPRPTTLALEPEFVVRNATLFVGALRLNTTEYRNPAFVNAERITLGAGLLTVCPLDTDQRGVLDQVELLREDCDDGQTFRHPRISFGLRSWLRFVGNFTGGEQANASLSMFVPNGPFGAPLWAHVPSSGRTELTLQDEQLRFFPLVDATEVRVRVGQDTTYYNGTGFAFVFNGSKRFDVFAAGASVTLQEPFHVSLGAAEADAVLAAIKPRTILDLQEAELGADRREAIRNVTRHFDLGRNPHFLAAAALGTWNGTVGPLNLTEDTGMLVRLESYEADYAGGWLNGTAAARFVLFSDRVSLDGQPSADAPLVLGLVLWIGAFVAYAIGRAWPVRPRWLLWAERSLYPLGLVIWDLVLHDAMGVSGLAILGGRVSLATGLGLFVFELVSWTMAWLLLFFPTRSIMRRTLPARLRLATSPAAFGLLIVYVLVFPAKLFALGNLVARL